MINGEKLKNNNSTSGVLLKSLITGRQCHSIAPFRTRCEYLSRYTILRRRTTLEILLLYDRTCGSTKDDPRRLGY